MRIGLVIGCVLLGLVATGCGPSKKYVVVEKSARKMYVKQGGRVLREFDIALGKRPVGHKLREGDKRTPEGVYRLGYKNKRSSFHKSIHISYPNAKDRARARRFRVRPGGAIVVHGLPNGRSKQEVAARWGKDWTDGCIALNNQDMNEFWGLINKPGTLIKINP